MLTKISGQLETLCNLIQEPKKEATNYDDLLTKLQANQQEFFHQLDKLISEKLNLVKTELKPTLVQTEKEPKTQEKIPRKVAIRQPKDQPLKVDLAELERQTGLKKDWKNPAWNRAWKNAYNKTSAAREQKRLWRRKNSK